MKLKELTTIKEIIHWPSPFLNQYSYI